MSFPNYKFPVESHLLWRAYSLILFLHEKDLITYCFNREFCISFQGEEWDENSGFFLQLSFIINNGERLTPTGL